MERNLIGEPDIMKEAGIRPNFSEVARPGSELEALGGQPCGSTANSPPSRHCG